MTWHKHTHGYENHFVAKTILCIFSVVLFDYSALVFVLRLKLNQIFIAKRTTQQQNIVGVIQKKIQFLGSTQIYCIFIANRHAN